MSTSRTEYTQRPGASALRLWVLTALVPGPEGLSAIRLHLSWAIFEREDLGKCGALRRDNAHTSQPDTCVF